MSPRDQPPLQNHVVDDQQPLLNAATDDKALASDTESVPDLAPAPGEDDPAPAADAGNADTDDDLWQVPGMNNATNAATFAAFLASVLHQMQPSDNSPPNDASGNHTS